MELADRETCYRALESRDARFDGLIFVGVSSTGVYCRPVCPARTPKFEHCQFFRSAAAARPSQFTCDPMHYQLRISRVNCKRDVTIL
jgi:AraC family transcriptional regulator of adaptative response / DNA-3-methyladenine glycosylase II